MSRNQQAVEIIAQMEGVSLAQLLRMVEAAKPPTVMLSGAVGVFVREYAKIKGGTGVAYHSGA